jgi:hypothetical protein
LAHEQQNKTTTTRTATRKSHETTQGSSNIKANEADNGYVKNNTPITNKGNRTHHNNKENARQTHNNAKHRTHPPHSLDNRTSALPSTENYQGTYETTSTTGKNATTTTRNQDNPPPTTVGVRNNLPLSYANTAGANTTRLSAPKRHKPHLLTTDVEIVLHATNTEERPSTATTTSFRSYYGHKTARKSAKPTTPTITETQDHQHPPEHHQAATGANTT